MPAGDVLAADDDRLRRAYAGCRRCSARSASSPRPRAARGRDASASTAAWSGWRSNVRNEQPIWLPVVSWPPTIRLPTIVRTSSCVSRSPSTSATTSALTRSSPGAARRCSSSRSTYAFSLANAARGRVGLLGRHEPEHDAQRVGPAGELGDVAVGDADQPADHTQRQQVRRRRRGRRPRRPAAARTSPPAIVDRGGADGVDRARRECLLHEQAKPAVRVALVGEHQAAVPIAQRPVGDAHHVEVAEARRRPAAGHGRARRHRRAAARSPRRCRGGANTGPALAASRSASCRSSPNASTSTISPSPASPTPASAANVTQD